MLQHFTTFDVRQAQISKASDREHLLGVIQSGTINWGSVMTYAATDGMHLNRIVDWSSMPPPRPPVPSPSYHGQELQNAGYGGSSGS